MQSFITEFPVSTSFVLSHMFWDILILFSFVFRYILISFLIFVIQRLFKGVLLNFHVFVNFSIYLLLLIGVLFNCVYREDTWNDFNLLKFVKTCL